MLQRECTTEGGVAGHAAQEADFLAGGEGGDVGEEDQASGEGAGAHESSRVHTSDMGPELPRASPSLAPARAGDGFWRNRIF